MDSASELQQQQQPLSDSAVPTAPSKHWYNKFVGIALCVITSLLVALGSTAVKLVHLPGTELVFARCCYQYLFLLPFTAYTEYTGRLTIFVSDRRVFALMMLRSVLSCGALLCFYNSLQRIAIGDATAVTFCSVIFAGIASKLFLGEAYTPVDAAFAALAIAGVCLIAQPEFLFGADSDYGGGDKLLGIGMAFTTAVLTGGSTTVLRRLSQVDIWVGLFYYCVCSLFLTGGMLLLEGGLVWPCLTEMPAIVLLGVLAPSSNFLLAKSLQYERSSTVGVMRSVEVVIVYVIQVGGKGG